MNINVFKPSLIQAARISVIGDWISKFCQKRKEKKKKKLDQNFHFDRTFGPDVEVPTGVSCDGVSILSECHTQHILWFLVFLQSQTNKDFKDYRKDCCHRLHLKK